MTLVSLFRFRGTYTELLLATGDILEEGETFEINDGFAYVIKVDQQGTMHIISLIGGYGVDDQSHLRVGIASALEKRLCTRGIQ